ncbi:hypothetical protein SELMODRAFT_123789 [Selaginella moellendorffii]|uniref:Pentacotripeptide-repeat region of PRORP domain-containing protein n=1 Tax=Selaginella moellendorffii TaxID=88036 RepID=D8SSX3_SELML|nr:hypothetical protein SELMODRAFT_123789 [Selaginella moellendorffii]
MTSERLKSSLVGDLDAQGFASLLRECARSRDFAEGSLVHQRIIASSRHRHDRFLQNLVVRMYGECGRVDEAAKVFHSIARKNLFSWSSMIAAFAQNGHSTAAVELYSDMIQRSGLRPDSDVIAWNSIIAVLSQHGELDRALELYRKMDESAVPPDRITLASLLDGCGGDRPRELEIGRFIDKESVRKALRGDPAIDNALIRMYGRCRRVEEARAVFATMGLRNLASWNAIIAANAQNGCGSVERARNVFAAMEERDLVSWTAIISANAANGHFLESVLLYLWMIQEGVLPDRITYATLLAGCLKQRAIDPGRMIHAHIESFYGRSMDRDNVLGSHLVNLYRRCGSLEEAKSVFDRLGDPDASCWSAMIASYAQSGYGSQALELFQRMDRRGINTVNTATWNAMIGAYAQNGHPGAGLELYQQMKSQGIQPDRATLVIALDAAAMIEEFELGRDVLIDGALEHDERVATAMIGILARSGKTIRAKRVFDSIPRRDEICWSAMVTAYAQNGHSILALELFSEMVVEGFVADKAAIVSILAACSQSGDFRRGRSYFTSMQADFSVDPIAEHYACVIDLFSRIGWIREAQELAREMPFKADRAAAMALLAGGRTGGVRSFRGDDLGASLDCAAPYVLLSNIYKQSV